MTKQFKKNTEKIRELFKSSFIKNVDEINKLLIENREIHKSFKK